MTTIELRKSDHVAQRRTLRLPLVLIAAFAVLLGVAACGSNDDDSSGSRTDSSSQADALTVSDAWVKAVAEPGMTGAFGTVTNNSDKDVRIVSGSSDLAGSVELHEVVDGQMQQIEGGFTVPAKGTLTLAPGGNHIMLMGLTEPIGAGNDVAIVLTCADGSTIEFEGQARDFAGAQEDYAP